MEARPYAPLPPPDPLVHIIIQQDCKKGLRIWSQSKWKKEIAGRNAIHFGTRNVDWECNPFKKDFTDACPPDSSVRGYAQWRVSGRPGKAAAGVAARCPAPRPSRGSGPGGCTASSDWCWPAGPTGWTCRDPCSCQPADCAGRRPTVWRHRTWQSDTLWDDRTPPAPARPAGRVHHHVHRLLIRQRGELVVATERRRPVEHQRARLLWVVQRPAGAGPPHPHPPVRQAQAPVAPDRNPERPRQEPMQPRFTVGDRSGRRAAQRHVDGSRRGADHTVAILRQCGSTPARAGRAAPPPPPNGASVPRTGSEPKSAAARAAGAANWAVSAQCWKQGGQ